MDELKEFDCKKAEDALHKIAPNWNGPEFYFLRDFIQDVYQLQRKYTKPVAALLKGPNG